MATSIEQANAEFLGWLHCYTPTGSCRCTQSTYEIQQAARRIYGALIEQERQQAEVYRAEMVRAQDALRHQTLRGCQLYEEVQRLRSLLEDSCHTSENDQTPIDESWLRSIGWRPWPDEGEYAEFSLYLPLPDEVGWECRLAYQANGIYAVRMCDPDEHRGLVSESVELFGSRNSTKAVTRGQLVKLCNALGFNVNSEAKA